MKRTFGLLLILLIGAVSLVGCSQDELKEEEVLKFVKEYKTIQYNVENPDDLTSTNEEALNTADKVKPYLSEEAHEDMLTNRIFAFPLEYAKKTSSSLKVENFHLDKQEVNEDGSVDYKYTYELIADNGDSKEIMNRNGELTITKSDDGDLILTRDWERFDELLEAKINN